MNIDLPFNKDAPIAVTGGTGFVGSYLLRTLVNQGCTQIKALRRKTSKMDLLGDAKDKIEWIEGDLLDTEIIRNFTKNIDLLFHCAAFVSFNPSEKKKLYRINVGGTAELVDAALENGVKKVVHCSSVAALGQDLKGQPINEETEWREFSGISDYALSKYYSELEIWRAAAEGLNVTVLNPSVVLGAGYWNQGSAAMIKQVNREVSFYPAGDGGFVDVRDVAKMMIMCADEKLNNRRFISSADNHSYHFILQRIAEHLDKPVPSRKINNWMIHTLPPILKLLRSFGMKVPPLSKPMLRAAAKKSQYDNSSFIKATGFTYYPLEKTISQSCIQFKKSLDSDKRYGLLSID